MTVAVKVEEVVVGCVCFLWVGSMLWVSSSSSSGCTASKMRLWVVKYATTRVKCAKVIPAAVME